MEKGGKVGLLKNKKTTRLQKNGGKQWQVRQRSQQKVYYMNIYKNVLGFL